MYVSKEAGALSTPVDTNMLGTPLDPLLRPIRVWSHPRVDRSPQQLKKQLMLV